MSSPTKRRHGSPLRSTTHVTFYSKLVLLKKRIYPTPIIPQSIGSKIDVFFNSLHSLRTIFIDNLIDALIVSKDRTLGLVATSLEKTRDTIIVSKDVTRDALVKTKDVVRDKIIVAGEKTRDSIIVSKDLTRDSIVDASDAAASMVHLAQVQSVRSMQTPPQSLLRRVTLIFRVGYVFCKLLFVQLPYAKYSITPFADQKAVSHIDSIIANSKNTRDKIRAIYKKNSVIVFPPILKPRKLRSHSSQGYWLSVNRLFPDKRAEVQLDSFRDLPCKLIIVGGHDNHNPAYVRQLVERCPANVYMVGEVSESQLQSYYAHCEGFLTTAVGEDFGMTVVEAMSYGKPVIAPCDGGYKESVIHNKNGILLPKVTAQTIAVAVVKIRQLLARRPDFFIERNREQAELFSEDIFTQKIVEQINLQISSRK